MIEDARLPERFRDKVIAAPSGCWIWTGSTNDRGYGKLKFQGRYLYAHRLAYEVLVEPIPDGLVIDHLCRNRRCVRPLHLQPVTTRINLLRGMTITARNAGRQSCPQGHRYNSKNTHHSKYGRKCRACARERAKEAYYR